MNGPFIESKKEAGELSILFSTCRQSIIKWIDVWSRQKMQVEEGKYFLVLHRFITPWLISHPSITEWGGQPRLKPTEQQTEQVSKSQVWRKDRKLEHKSMRETQMLLREAASFLWLYSITACVFPHPCDSHLGLLAPWPPCWLPILSSALSLSSWLTCSLHWRVECRQRTFNLTPLL